jgi:membrane-bound inhibitor of C-type lysozyme
MTAIVSRDRDWSILTVPPGENMNCREIARLAAALLITTIAGVTTAAAQTTFQTYRCADGTEFIVGFFQYDKRAHVQVDGKAVTLLKRLTLSGARYSGSGVTLRTQKSGATLKVGKRKPTACQLT